MSDLNHMPEQLLVKPIVEIKTGEQNKDINKEANKNKNPVLKPINGQNPNEIKIVNHPDGNENMNQVVDNESQDIVISIDPQFEENVRQVQNDNAQDGISLLDFPPAYRLAMGLNTFSIYQKITEGVDRIDYTDYQVLKDNGVKWVNAKMSDILNANQQTEERINEFDDIDSYADLTFEQLADKFIKSWNINPGTEYQNFKDAITNIREYLKREDFDIQEYSNMFSDALVYINDYLNSHQNPKSWHGKRRVKFAHSLRSKLIKGMDPETYIKVQFDETKNIKLDSSRFNDSVPNYLIQSKEENKVGKIADMVFNVNVPLQSLKNDTGEALPPEQVATGVIKKLGFNKDNISLPQNIKKLYSTLKESNDGVSDESIKETIVLSLFNTFRIKAQNIFKDIKLPKKEKENEAKKIVEDKVKDIKAAKAKDSENEKNKESEASKLKNDYDTKVKTLKNNIGSRNKEKNEKEKNIIELKKNYNTLSDKQKENNNSIKAKNDRISELKKELEKPGKAKEWELSNDENEKLVTDQKKALNDVRNISDIMMINQIHYEAKMRIIAREEITNQIYNYPTIKEYAEKYIGIQKKLDSIKNEDKREAERSKQASEMAWLQEQMAKGVMTLSDTTKKSILTKIKQITVDIEKNNKIINQVNELYKKDQEQFKKEWGEDAVLQYEMLKPIEYTLDVDKLYFDPSPNELIEHYQGKREYKEEDTSIQPIDISRYEELAGVANSEKFYKLRINPEFVKRLKKEDEENKEKINAEIEQLNREIEKLNNENTGLGEQIIGINKNIDDLQKQIKELDEKNKKDNEDINLANTNYDNSSKELLKKYNKAREDNKKEVKQKEKELVKFKLKNFSTLENSNFNANKEEYKKSVDQKIGFMNLALSQYFTLRSGERDEVIRNNVLNDVEAGEEIKENALKKFITKFCIDSQIYIHDSAEVQKFYNANISPEDVDAYVKQVMNYYNFINEQTGQIE